MATYFDGEKLKNVSTVEYTGNTATLYTVPTGRYAKINFMQFLSTDPNDHLQIIASNGVTVLNEVENIDVAWGLLNGYKLVLFPGQRIKVQNSSTPVSCAFTIREFEKPN